MITIPILIILFLVGIVPGLVALTYVYNRTKIHNMILKDKAENYEHLIGKK